MPDDVGGEPGSGSGSGLGSGPGSGIDATTYCRDKAAPPGSAGYYSVLLLPPAARVGMLGLLALARELDEVVEQCSDRSVAQHKLAWWQQELAASNEAGARHPVTRCLSVHAPQALVALDRVALLAGVHDRIVRTQYRDTGELDASCDRTAGCIGRACAPLLASRDGDCAEKLAGIFVACERVRLLSLPWRAGQPPHTGVALDLLTRAGARPDDVDRARDTPPARRLRRDLLAAARETLQRAIEHLPGTRGFAATRGRIARAQLRALERGGYVAAGTARMPLPITLLWLAWRHRPRQHASARRAWD